jgi:hypothetical protein
MLAQRREFVSCKRALANYAEQRTGAAHAVPDVCSTLAQASRTAAQTFQLRYFIPQAEWDVTLHPSVSASLHSYMVVQQKLHTAASASVQACTGAEQLQQARKCTKVGVCASLHRHQQCITAPAAWDSKRASQKLCWVICGAVSCKHALTCHHRSEGSSARRSRSCSTDVPAIPAQQATRCCKRAHRGALLSLGRSAVASMHCRAQERLVQRRRAPLRNEQLAASVRKLFGCTGTGKRVSARVHLPFASAGRAPGTALQHCASLHSAEQRGRTENLYLAQIRAK